MMNFKNKAVYLNWITAFIWSWYLLYAWTDLPIPAFIVPDGALVAFIILCLQIFAHCDIKNILCFKDRETNFIAIIALVTIVCLVLSHSGFGAFFTVFNLCLLWYLSDKWVWEKEQIILLGAVFLYLYVSWLYKPMQLGTETNPNTTGTITVFSMLVLITVIKYLFPNKKWTLLIEIPLVILSLHKLLVYHGRGSLIALVLYVILRLLSLTKIWGKKFFYKTLCYLLTLGSLFFVLVYTSVWRITGVNFVLPYWNKSIFSGRERIWYELWTYFKPHFLTGIGTNVTLESWFEYNVHNAIYSILITHGIIVFILVMVYMIKKMGALYSKYKHCFIFIPAVSGILAIFMESFFDMDLLWFPQFLVWSFMLVVLASVPPSSAPAPFEGE